MVRHDEGCARVLRHSLATCGSVDRRSVSPFYAPAASAISSVAALRSFMQKGFRDDDGGRRRPTALLPPDYYQRAEAAQIPTQLCVLKAPAPKDGC